ncbi:MAG TPA: lysylphosphatidylglycerol synthase transmembrane domain-containing protein [Gaiellaceae bacterium]|nr:lysylphosphatidylglycerol synthase transmembrane domain-containing protein [Gaiellaceae bacterium]
MLHDRRWRFLLVLPLLAAAVALFIFRGPDWQLVNDAFTIVSWQWVFAAIGLNLLSVLARALAWDTTIKQSLDPPYPRFPTVFSAFSVGLFANAVLPGRVGELARVAVLRRRVSGPRGTTATLIGSVFAHRMFDVFPATALVIWVLLAAKIPGWALTSIAVVLALGVALFVAAILLARRAHRDALEGLGPVRQLLARARQGLAVMRSPVSAATAAAFQFAGWFCQLLAVWSAMYAFHIHEQIAAAGLVLVLINVATIFPLWPGNFGLVQIAVALPLVNYGVPYARGFAFGIGLQAIEASVGVGVGLIFLAREGISYAMLKAFEDAPAEAVAEIVDPESGRARSRIAG